MHGFKILIRYFLFIFLVLGLEVPADAQHKIPASYCLSPAEKILADSINALRVKYGKKPLPLSVSLSYVAKSHVIDLSINHPDTSICNLSSWSNKGAWTPCCYNAYVVNHDGMWKKPQELTSYRYRGYELAAWSENLLQIDTLLTDWKTTPEAMEMILTRGKWEKKKWACMGIGISDHYVSLWFGQRPDSQGKPKLCIKKKRASVSKSNRAKVQKSTKIPTYYLILGTYKNMKNATEALRRFRKIGFSHAGVLRKDHKIRIYANRYKGFKAALKAKQKLPFSYRDAWILEQ